MLACLLVAACADQAAPPPSPSPSASPVALGPPAYRGVWVDAFHDGIKSAAQVEKLVADARRANLNALFVQVRKRGDAYFNRGLEPRATDIQGPAYFDPLAALIRLAHAQYPRLEVHAWVNTFFVGSDSRVYREHGEEWGNRTRDGQRGGFLDPGNPAVAIYTHDVLLDLVGGYELDGLHLDFIRYPDGGDWGYSPAALARFRLETGAQDVPQPADEAFRQWRRDQLTAFVRSLYQDLTARKPALKLSAALICYGRGPVSESEWRSTAAYTSVFQDWRSWLQEGILDLAVPMNYDSGYSPRQAGWFALWLEFEKDLQSKRKVLIGLGPFLNYPDDALAQIRQALAPSTHGNATLGVVLYSYASTSVFATEDFYLNPDLAGSLPRQPYYDGTQDPAALRARARTFNDWFWTQLSQPDYYRDPARGWVPTQPVFPEPAATPTLPWKII